MMKREELHILYLEDEPDDAYLVERALKKGGYTPSFVLVDCRKQFVEAIRNNHFDVILSDHSLPQFNSTEAIKICKRAQVIVPIILVTGTVSEEFAANCIKMGADDYILKSNLNRLPQAIANAIHQRSLQAEKLTAELNLRLKNEELTKTNQELDSFVYSVSHNLRAPLMSVLGLLNLANKDNHARDPVYDHYFRMMEDSIKKLDITLKEIIEYSRNARLEPSFKTINFEDIIQQCVQRLHHLQGFDQIRIHTHISERENIFHCDVYRLTVILTNILTNAIQYRDITKDNSFIHMHIDIANGQGATLRIEDNGIGIPSDQIEKVFNMFYRATDKSNGAGLGLYIVQEIVEKLKGNINVTSTVGVGTIFSIALPQGMNYKKLNLNTDEEYQV